VADLFAMSGGNPLETELNTFRTIQSEISKVQGNISTAQTQILENELVLKELDILEDDAGVFKLIGPVLVKQELLEVKNNVSKRIEFIKSDIKRLEERIKNYEKQGEQCKANVAKLQQQARGQ